MTKRTTRGPTSKYEIPTLDEEMFHTLFDILHDGCMEGNYAATARILSISTLTARKWATNAPKDRWMNHILRQAIIFVYQLMADSVHKKIRKRAEKVKGQMQRAGYHKLVEYMEYNEANNTGARRHLLVTLNLAPGQTMSIEDLRKPANSGGYSMKTLRSAAVALQLDRETEGFGEEKTTYWSIPREY